MLCRLRIKNKPFAQISETKGFSAVPLKLTAQAVHSTRIRVYQTCIPSC